MSFAFHPKATITIFLLAGLLARLVFGYHLIQLIGTMAFIECQNANRLTAAGTAPDFNRIPLLIQTIKTSENH